MNELRALWGQFLGTPPSDQQFEFWSTLHSPEVIRRGILKTAQKNLSVGGTMSADHRLRFASKVMIAQTERNRSNAANRETLRREMEAR
jgi:hypothetical protein